VFPRAGVLVEDARAVNRFGAAGLRAVVRLVAVFFFERPAAFRAAPRTPAVADFGFFRPVPARRFVVRDAAFRPAARGLRAVRLAMGVVPKNAGPVV
jgi:hypothetical protein